MTQSILNPEALMAKGWKYRDWPNMRPELWNELLETLGEGNYELLTEAKRTWPDGAVTLRGQMLISPDGATNLVALNSKASP